MKWRARYPLKEFQVESGHRHPDTGEKIYYTIELWHDGEIICNCIAGSYFKPCHHKDKKKAELIKEFGSVNQAVEYYKINK